jgi:hypothetical protein
MALTARDRRTLMIGGGVVAVLLVGFLVFNLVSGGGGLEPLPSFSLRPPASATSTGSPANESAPPPALNGRDPFSIPPGAGGVSSPTGTSTTSGTSSPTGTSTSTSTSTPTLPGGGSSTRIGGHDVVLLDVFSRGGVSHAQVEVDGTVYRPAVGERFAGGEFRLVSTSGSCAVLLFGDQSFTLCATQLK